MPKIEIKPLNHSSETCNSLAEILVEIVADGGSVSFMHPLPIAEANHFWETSFAAAARGDRIILGAFIAQQLAGTVTLILDCPPNQPHRAEIAKMMTRIIYRQQGVAKALLEEAERLAIQYQRSLLVLDTATEDGAGGLYEKHGYQLTGIIPDYALKPHGGLTGTMIYWKKLSNKQP